MISFDCYFPFILNDFVRQYAKSVVIYMKMSELWNIFKTIPKVNCLWFLLWNWNLGLGTSYVEMHEWSEGWTSSSFSLDSFDYSVSCQNIGMMLELKFYIIITRGCRLRCLTSAQLTNITEVGKNSRKTWFLAEINDRQSI